MLLALLDVFLNSGGGGKGGPPSPGATETAYNPQAAYLVTSPREECRPLSWWSED